MDNRQIFIAAWTAARAAAARFGGRAREYFGHCLRDAYAALRAPAEREVEVEAVRNAYNSRMSGKTYLTFAHLPDGQGGYRPGVRADQLDGALYLSRAAYVGGRGYARSADRYSTTTVRLTLPTGTILRCTDGTVERVDGDGNTDLRLVGNMRRGGGWVSVIADETGREIHLA